MSSDISDKLNKHDNISAVWKYLRINNKIQTVADSKLCSSKLSRGGTKSGLCDTSLTKQLS